MGYARDIRPDLTGNASLGYVTSVNTPTSTIGVSASSLNTTTATLGLNYLLGRSLTGSIVYSFIYQSNGGGFAGGRSGDVVANQLQLLLSKTF